MMNKSIAALLLSTTFIFQLSAQTTVTTVTGEFNGSGGVKIGPDGCVYIADFGTGLQNPDGTKIWKYDPITDTLTEFVSAGLSGASGNDFDSQGNLFQSNIAASTISKITPQGVISQFTAVGISSPVGIVIDDLDNLFVCNCGSNTIQKVTSTATSTQFSSDPLLSCPNGITRDWNGVLYVSNFGNGNVLKLDSLGNASVLATIPGANNGHLFYSNVDSMLYVASHGSSSIYRLGLDGSLSTIAGSGIRGNQDGPANVATFSRPNGVALTLTGDTLYVNSSVPTTNVGLPLNPSLLRMVTGVQWTPSTALEEINDLAFEELSLYQAADGNLKVLAKTMEETNSSYYVYSLTGSIIISGSWRLQRGENKTEISLPEDISSGLYFFTLASEKQNISRAISIQQ